MYIVLYCKLYNKIRFTLQYTDTCISIDEFVDVTVDVFAKAKGEFSNL